MAGIEIANEMPDRSGYAYIRLHPHILQPATTPPFNVYMREGDSGTFTAFKVAGEPVYADTWDKLRQSDTDLLYVADEEADSCFDYVEDNLSAILKEDVIPSRQAAEWVYRLTCRGMAALLEEPCSTPTYARVQQLLHAIADMVRRHPGSEWHMMDCAPLTYYTHSHCINVAVLLASLATRVLGVDERGLLGQVLLGGALHDLGKALVPAEILQKPGPLTSEEFKLIERHPRDGVKMARPYLRQAPIAKCIIRQHHEDVCGGGYPDGRSGATINLFARAARIVDVFDALTSHRPYRSAMDSQKALGIMVNDMRGKLDDDILQRFINLLPSRFTVEAPVPAPRAEVPRQAVPHPWGEGELRWHPSPPPDAAVPPAPLPAQAEDEGEGHRRPVTEYRSAAGKTIIDTEPTPQQQLEAMRELIGEKTQAAAQIQGVSNGLEEALGDKLREPADEAPVPQARPHPEKPGVAQVPLADQGELALIQSLLGILWELDAWRKRFETAGEPEPSGEGLRSEILTCLESLRESIAETLGAHKVQINAK